MPSGGSRANPRAFAESHMPEPDAKSGLLERLHGDAGPEGQRTAERALERREQNLPSSARGQGGKGGRVLAGAIRAATSASALTRHPARVARLTPQVA